MPKNMDENFVKKQKNPGIVHVGNTLVQRSLSRDLLYFLKIFYAVILTKPFYAKNPRELPASAGIALMSLRP